MFLKQQIFKNFIGFYPVVESKASLQFDAFTRISALYRNILMDVMEYLGRDGPVVNFRKC